MPPWENFERTILYSNANRSEYEELKDRHVFVRLSFRNELEV